MSRNPLRPLVVLLAMTAVASAAPRLISPLSTSRITSQRPPLRWEGRAGTRAELCHDRPCTQIIETLDGGVTGAVPSKPLPPGVVFWRVRTSDGVETSASWSFTVGHRSAPVATISGQVCDVNGDDFADTLAGDRLYLGGRDGLAATPPAKVAVSARQAAVCIGDLDGDGYSDVVVADPKNKRLSIFHGSPAGLSPSARTTVDAPSPSRTFGQSIAGPGDVNGDGYADLIVGAPGVLEAYVYLGGPSGISPRPVVTLSQPSRHEHSDFGDLVGAAADVTGDGIADFFVLASSSNSLYVYQGATPLPGSKPLITKFGGGDTQFPSTMAAAGDVDGDGY